MEVAAVEAAVEIMAVRMALNYSGRVVIFLKISTNLRKKSWKAGKVCMVPLHPQLLLLFFTWTIFNSSPIWVLKLHESLKFARAKN